MNVDDNDRNADAVLFAVVRREPGGGHRIREAVISFESAAAADLFAIEAGWVDYQVCELRFLVESLAVAPSSRDGAGNPGRADDGLSGVGTWKVVVAPGMNAVDLLRAAALIPSGFTFCEAYGDVEVTLVFRGLAGARPTAPDPAGPPCGGLPCRTRRGPGTRVTPAGGTRRPHGMKGDGLGTVRRSTLGTPWAGLRSIPAPRRGD